MKCVVCGNTELRITEDGLYECQSCGSRFSAEEIQETEQISDIAKDEQTFDDSAETTCFETELGGEENLARFSSSLGVVKKRNLKGVKIGLSLILLLIGGIMLWNTIGIRSLAKKEYSSIIDDLDVGEVVYFGTYEQDANESNGTEEILWEVIAEENDKLLLLSAYSLDCKEYSDWVKNDVYWEISYTREWLNDTFYEEAFDKYQRSLIVKASLENKDNYQYSTYGGPSTKDKVFLLSADEFNAYVTGNIGIGINSEYADRKGLGGKPLSRRTIWRLRTPGKQSDYVACVDVSGHIDISGVGVSESLPVRPAIWIYK